MKILAKKKCLQLMCDMQMPEHIVAHSLQVCRVGVCLVDHLKLQGIQMDRQLVIAAALLHDITKTRSFTTRENHAQTGAQFLSDMGYPEVGHIIEQHVRLDSYAASDFPTEAEIVNYADKRVLHDRIVTLKERMNYILEKYAKGPEYRERLLWLWNKTEELELRLFSYVPFRPEELGRLLDQEGDGNDFLPFASFRSDK